MNILNHHAKGEVKAVIAHLNNGGILARRENSIGPDNWYVHQRGWKEGHTATLVRVDDVSRTAWLSSPAVRQILQSVRLEECGRGRTCLDTLYRKKGESGGQRQETDEQATYRAMRGMT